MVKKGRKMKDNNINEYITNRVDDQIKYFNEKAIKNKKIFYFWKIIIIVLSSLITILSIYSNINECVKYTIIIISVIITAIESIHSLFHSDRLYIIYRSTCESLIREKNLFINNANIYSKQSEKEKFTMFVDNIEYILARTNTTWNDEVSKDNK